jgi:drug/metabolite transporter (DMT)-like permease
MSVQPPRTGRAFFIPLPAAAAIFCLLWSSAFAVSKIGLADCPPLLFLAARLLIAGAVILSLGALTGAPWRFTRRDLVALAAIGVANNALYLALNYIGMRSVSAGLTALIGSANPVLTALLAWVLLGEPMTSRKVAGLVLGVGGVAFVVAGRISVGADGTAGIACIVVALVSLVTGTILLRRFAPPGLWMGNGVQNLLGGLAVVPFALTFESFGEVVPSSRLAVALLFLALLVSVVGYFLWAHLIMTAGAAAASAYHFVMPPLGFIFGWLLLGEHISARDLIGIMPIVIGIYLITRPRGAPSVSSAAAGGGAAVASEARTNPSGQPPYPGDVQGRA